jgi:SAM-dependent methyltransferase
MGNMYNDGRYLGNNPTWDIEHSDRKASELYNLLIGQLQNIRLNENIINITEVGCGFGGVIAGFAKLISKTYTTRCIGIDISQVAIENAVKNFGSNVTFIRGDIHNIPVENDILIFADIIEHLDEPERFIRYASTRTKVALIRIPLDQSLWNILLRKKSHLRKHLGHLHFYTWKKALELVQTLGFSVVVFNFTNNFEDPSNRKTVIANLMYLFRKCLSAISPKLNSLLFGGNSIVILAKSDSAT